MIPYAPGETPTKKAIALPKRRVPVSPLSQDEKAAGMEVCARCRELFSAGDENREYSLREFLPAAGPTRPDLDIGGQLDAIREAILCNFCRTILSIVLQDYHGYQRATDILHNVSAEDFEFRIRHDVLHPEVPRFDFFKNQALSRFAHLDVLQPRSKSGFLRRKSFAWSSTRQPSSDPVEPENSSDGMISISLVRGWLASCDMHCGPQCQPLPIHTEDLLFIDVVKGCLVTGENAAKYAALSYVWGKVDMLKTTKSNEAELRVPGSLSVENERLPQTIKDAIYFLQRLEIRLLWVDCLCVVQDDPKRMQHLIDNMGAVYSAAQLTLIAFSGDDASAGLPGASPGSRDPQPIVDVDGHKYVAVPQSVYGHFESYPEYETRAWTFQERLLSRRCLFFSRSQVWLQCQHDLYTEISDTGLDMYRKVTYFSPLIIRHSAMEMLPCPYIPQYTDGERLSKYRTFVEEYSRKHLTFQTDVLRACRSLIFLLHRETAFGIPTDARFLHEALMWAPAGRLLRRKNDCGEPLFPSWSWAAWEGPVCFPFEHRAECAIALEITPHDPPFLRIIGPYIPSQSFSLIEHATCSDVEYFASILDRRGNRCGLLFLDQPYDSKTWKLADDYFFHAINQGLDHFNYFTPLNVGEGRQPLLELDGEHSADGAYNVMLVRHGDNMEQCERLAVGFVAASAWDEAKPCLNMVDLSI